MKLMREPLVHFLAMGAGLFVLFEVIGGSTSDRTNEIVITPGLSQHIVEVWQKTRQRLPTPSELEGLINEHVREEILYREALAMGLDRDDTIVRRRLRQKLEFLLDDLADAIEPGERELRDFFEANPEPFRAEPRFSFSHVYLSLDRRGEGALADAEILLEQLQQADTVEDPAAFGDPLLMERDYEMVSEGEVAKLFGSAFSERLIDLPTGVWSGPVESAYGLHLVLVRERISEEAPAFEDVRERVHRNFMFERRREARETAYGELFKRYTVIREDKRQADPDVVASAEWVP
jgi:hypothetical protein